MKKCSVCNNHFDKPYKYSKKQWEATKYCSKQCFWVVSPLHKKGRRPWNYKGISTENKIERERFRRELQRLIFERDSYKCQICKQGGSLQIDHIKQWAKYPELRFDPNNCRTLCQSCHYFVTFGKSLPKEIKTWGHNLRQRRI